MVTKSIILFMLALPIIICVFLLFGALFFMSYEWLCELFGIKIENSRLGKFFKFILTDED